MARNKVIVRINGAEYTLIGDETEDYLFSIANYLDKKIKETLLSNSKHSNTSAAVLTALTVTDELFKIRRENEILKRSLNEPEEKIRQLRAEYDELHGAYMELIKEYEKYKESQQGRDDDINTLKSEYDELYASYINKNDENEKFVKENAYLKEQNELLQNEIKEARESISDLKDQLLESQIELVRLKKELKDLQNKKRNI